MRRRNFLAAPVAAGMAQTQSQTPLWERETYGGGTGSTEFTTEVLIDRKRTGKPYQGKVLAAIQPHCDDIPIFCGGTVLKLIEEGYTGYLITLSNDSMAGDRQTIGEIVLANERDTIEVGRRLKCKESIFLNYPNHNMDSWPLVEMRARLVFLFRVLRVDTVIVYDPSALYERNPDHYTTARAVESAGWMARSSWDYPEHFRSGLTAHGPSDYFYFARGPQIVNRVVDIGDYMDGKIHANLANVTQGPSGNNGAKMRKALAAKGRKLPLLGNDDDTANREYTKMFALGRDRVRGRKHGLQYAEYFHYVGPDESAADAYAERFSVPL